MSINVRSERVFHASFRIEGNSSRGINPWKYWLSLVDFVTGSPVRINTWEQIRNDKVFLEDLKPAKAQPTYFLVHSQPTSFCFTQNLQTKPIYTEKLKLQSPSFIFLFSHFSPYMNFSSNSCPCLQLGSNYSSCVGDEINLKQAGQPGIYFRIQYHYAWVPRTAQPVPLKTATSCFCYTHNVMWEVGD